MIGNGAVQDFLGFLFLPVQQEAGQEEN